MGILEVAANVIAIVWHATRQLVTVCKNNAANSIGLIAIKTQVVEPPMPPLMLNCSQT